MRLIDNGSVNDHIMPDIYTKQALFLELKILQGCQTHQNLRAETWPADTPVREKIYGPVENLQHTAAYVPATGVPGWANDEKEELKMRL